MCEMDIINSHQETHVASSITSSYQEPCLFAVYEHRFYAQHTFCTEIPVLYTETSNVYN